MPTVSHGSTIGRSWTPLPASAWPSCGRGKRLSSRSSAPTTSLSVSRGQSRAQLFPVDLVPRMVTAQEWGQLSDGLAQRARALDAFLRDVYSEQAIVADGIIGVQALDRAPGFRSTGRLAGDTVRAHISGTDLVCDRAGRWMVLEDNLRVPSGARVRDRQPPAAGKVPPRAATARRDRGRRPGAADAARNPARGGPAARTRRSHGGAAVRRAGKTPHGSSTPSWPRKWTSRWCSRRTCRCATESWCSTSVPTSGASTSCMRGWTRTCCCLPPDTTARHCARACSPRSPTAISPLPMRWRTEWPTTRRSTRTSRR